MITSEAETQTAVKPGNDAAFTAILAGRVTLMHHSGTVDVSSDFQPGNVCDTPGLRTSVSITKLELMPSPRNEH